MRLSRRELLACGALLPTALRGQQNRRDEVTASATIRAREPCVGVVLSSSAEGYDARGRWVPGLTSTQPTDADLSTEFVEAWVRKAIAMAGDPFPDLFKLVARDDWVVIKTDISCCYGLNQPFIPGSVTDLRLVRAVINYLMEHKRGARITIAEGSQQWLPADRSKSAVDGWTTDWGGAFDGLSYKKMVEDFSKKYPDVDFDIADLNFAESLELPVLGKPLGRLNPAGRYTVAKVIDECDIVISIAPLKTDATTGVALTFSNYLGFAPGAKYGFPKSGLLKLGSPEEVMVDLHSYHPADFSILGGPFGVEGDGPAGPGAAPVHYNVLVAGARPASVDAVAATLMGFNVEQLPYLALAGSLGYGSPRLRDIWMRCSPMEQALRPFRKPSNWGTHALPDR
jgi:uncharacterized protein (DUF362 family)